MITSENITKDICYAYYGMATVCDHIDDAIEEFVEDLEMVQEGGRWGALSDALYEFVHGKVVRNDIMQGDWPLTLRLLEYIRPHRRHVWEAYDALYTHVMSLAQTPEQAAEIREFVP